MGLGSTEGFGISETIIINPAPDCTPAECSGGIDPGNLTIPNSSVIT